MGWDGGQTWLDLLAAKCECLSGFLATGSAKKKICYQWNHLVKTPCALGVRKTDGHQLERSKWSAACWLEVQLTGHFVPDFLVEM